MNLELFLERCETLVNSQLQTPRPRGMPEKRRYRTITFSRQAGSGAHPVATKLAELLQANDPKDDCPWTIFDRNLVEKVLHDHKLPSRFAKFMAEDRMSEISDTMDELFGLHPSSWTLVHKTADSILHLADLGHVILIGRGCNVITSKLDHVYHVRLVGSVEKRLVHIQEHHQLSKQAALEFLKREDIGRRRFVKKYFDKDIDDPLLYHLVINTDLVPYEEAARMIADTVTASTPQMALA